MKKILLIALSVIAFAACTKKDNDNDAKYTRAQLEGQWNYVESRMSDGKLFSQIVPAEVFNCIKKMNYIFKGDRWILNEYNYKNDEKTCKYNSGSFLYVVKGSTICFVINDKLNSSSKCNGIHINNLFKFFVWCEVSKSFTRSII